MEESIPKRKDSLRSPFRGMLIFIAVLFIVAMLIYRSQPKAAIIKSGKTDTAGAMSSRDSTHPE